VPSELAPLIEVFYIFYTIGRLYRSNACRGIIFSIGSSSKSLSVVPVYEA